MKWCSRTPPHSTMNLAELTLLREMVGRDAYRGYNVRLAEGDLPREWAPKKIAEMMEETEPNLFIAAFQEEFGVSNLG